MAPVMANRSRLPRGPASGERLVVEKCSATNSAGRESSHIEASLWQFNSVGVLIRHHKPNQVATPVRQAEKDHIPNAHAGNTVRRVNTIIYGLRACGREC